MRGQFMTAGALRLLHFALFVCVLSCHPIRNKLYVPLILAFWGVVFAVIDAAEGQDWTATAMLVCCFAFLMALCIQNAVIASKKRREKTQKSKEYWKSKK